MHLLFFFFYCGGVFTRGRKKCISNSNVSIKTMYILCAGYCFPGLFCDSAGLSRMHVHKKSLCSDLLGRLGGGEQSSSKGRWKRRLSLSFFMFCYNTVQNPASQPALAKDSLISFRLCHGERKKDHPQAPNYGSSLLSSPYIFPQK